MVSSLECFIYLFFFVVLFSLHPLQVLDIPSEDSFTQTQDEYSVFSDHCQTTLFKTKPIFYLLTGEPGTSQN